jgi:hypothetical protein
MAFVMAGPGQDKEPPSPAGRKPGYKPEIFF